MEVIHTLFGEGKELNELQMGCRAFVLFFITLGIIRLAGMRTFGKKSAFDNIIVIMLGAVLSRAIVGVSPFFPTVVAGIVLGGVHRLVAWTTVHNKAIGILLKGKRMILFENGNWYDENLQKCTISKDDVLEELRTELNETALSAVQEIYMETSGKISFIKVK